METSGRMQRPPELVPIPEYLQKASESSEKLLNLGKISKKFDRHLAKIQQILAKFAKFKFLESVENHENLK